MTLINSYDEIPYLSLAHPQTHPRRIGAIGRLFGIETADIRAARILEIGCASGANIIPIAAQHPDSSLIGIDLSSRQIETGNEIISKLGLVNISLFAMSLLDIPENFGEFDYIIVHGLLSWVPEEVGNCIFEQCQKHLAPNGVALISYNALPGWNMRKIVREAMLFHTKDISDSAQKVAHGRAFLAILAGENKNTQSAYSQFLAQESENLSRRPESYILHEFLEEDNRAFYFNEVLSKAFNNDLDYLADATQIGLLPQLLSRDQVEFLNKVSPGNVAAEQYIDFFQNRTFRESLFVKKECKHGLAVSADCVKNMFFSSDAYEKKCKNKSHYRFNRKTSRGDCSISTDNVILKNALEILAENFPQSLCFDDILNRALQRHTVQHKNAYYSAEQSQRLAKDFLIGFFSGVLDMYLEDIPVEINFRNKKPRVADFSRHIAQVTGVLINLRHETLTPDMPLLRLCVHCNGENSEEQLENLLLQDVHHGLLKLSSPESGALLKDYVKLALPEIAKKALLVID